MTHTISRTKHLLYRLDQIAIASTLESNGQTGRAGA